MILTIKQKLYKTKKTKFLERKLGVACYIYNHCIAVQKTYYRLFKKYLTKAKLQAHLAQLKKTHPWWKQVNSQTIQNIVERIDWGYQKFFRQENSRPPNFKGRHKYRSLTFKNSGWKVDRNHLMIQGATFKFHQSRPLGIIKRLVVKRDPVGDWYVSFTCEVTEEPKSRIKTGQIAGFDFGLKTFLTSDSGEKTESPEFYRQGIKLIKKLGRKLSSKKKGSGNRARARIALARTHRKVANQRLDHHFKLAKELAETFDEIFIEDLCLKGMVQLWGRKVNDLGFAQFASILKWQCKKHGASLVKIDRFYASTKTCSCCEFVNENLMLEDRQWTCPECSTHHDRDINAAKNIKRVGTSTLAGERVSASSLAIAC